MDIIAELVKLLMLPLVLILVPVIFVIIFDIAAHLGDLFGRRAGGDRP